jgi:pyrroline-5-carboxylate reductase
MKLGVIGCGHLARSIVKGVLKASVCVDKEILVSVQSDISKNKILEDYGWAVATSNQEIAKFADIIIISVKPHILVSLFIKDPNLGEALRGKLVISMLAGTTLRELKSQMPYSYIIRCITNLACSIQLGMLSFCCLPDTPPQYMENVVALFSCMGRCQILDETHFDAITAVSASSLAFFALIADAMIDGGVLMGLPRNVATEMIMQSMLGTTQLVLRAQESGNSFSPSQLKDSVMTPAGCTAAGIKAMEDGNIRATLIDTIAKCTERAEKLGSKEKA